MCCVYFLAPDREIRNALRRNTNIMPGTRASYPVKRLFSASSQHSFQFTSEQQVLLVPVLINPPGPACFTFLGNRLFQVHFSEKCQLLGSQSTPLLLTEQARWE